VKPFLFEAAAGIAGGVERPARAAAFGGGPATQQAVKPFQFEAVLRTTRNRRMFFENLGQVLSTASPVLESHPHVRAQCGGSAEIAQLEERERAVALLEVEVRILLSASFHKRFHECMAQPGQRHAESVWAMATVSIV
jgi:hypothetical protein